VSVKDVTESCEKSRAAEAVRRESEELLFAIMPRSIVARTDAGAART
jgi:hypothetical protein